jgi:hypothetical protein
MSKFQFTDEQVGNLKTWKTSLNGERARGWAEEEEKAEVVTSAILNDEKFKSGENLPPESWMNCSEICDFSPPTGISRT